MLSDANQQIGNSGASAEQARAAERIAGFERALQDLSLPESIASSAWLQFGWDDAQMPARLARRHGGHGRYCIGVRSSLAASRLRRQYPNLEWRIDADREWADDGASQQRGERFDFVLADLCGFAPTQHAPLMRRLGALLHEQGWLIVCEPDGPAATSSSEPAPMRWRVVKRGEALSDESLARPAEAANRQPPANKSAIAPADDHHDTFPLTDIQHAYWIGRGQALALGGVACHVYFEWIAPGLDLARFEAAWNRLLERHGMMRAVLTQDGRQRIREQVPYYRIDIEDWREADPERLAARLSAKREAMCAQVLNAQRGPLFDLRATREPGGQVRLHLDLDLLMFDVQSFHILLGELERIYRDPGIDLPAIGLSFRDYLAGQRDAAGEAAYRADRDWWRQRLADIAPPPDLPLARRSGEISRPSFRRLQRRLDPAQWQRLSALAGEAGLTGSAVLLCAFSEVLAQWAGNRRFTLNLTHFNRRRIHADVDKLIGDFTSVLLLTLDCGAPGSFARHAADTQAALWERLAHTRFGGVEVLRELARDRSRGDGEAGTLMPIVFTSLLGMDLDQLVRGADLLGEPEYLYTCTPQVWLDHQVMVRKGSLEFNWIVIDDLFPAGMIDAMFDSYCGLLDHLARDGAHWHAPVPALIPPAQLATRQAVNRTARDFALAPLHAGFFERAARQPEALACASAEQALRYGELAGRAMALCAALRERGVAPGERVGCLMPKCPDQIASALGIVAAGAVLVPLAVDTPPARLREIVADAGISCLVVPTPGDAREPDLPAAWLAFDSLDTGAGHSPELLARWARHAATHPDLDALAYLIYTSGSTGKPKGVAITHRAAANTLADIERRVGTGPDDRVLALSALGFDLAIHDVFGMLASGGALILPDEAGRRDPGHWLALMQHYRVSVWNSVPALLAMLLEHCEAGGGVLPTCLRRVLLSGDWIALDLPTRLRRQLPEVRIAALGGATEAAIWSNWFEVEQLDPAWRSIPYGFPLANQSYRILDSQMRDCPDWVPGDLHIGGVGLAREYWGDPRRTASAFVPEAGGERLYRTGDKACYWPDGCIEFLGRADSQIKLGGYRIELGEIEVALVEAGEVAAAAATVYRNAAGAQQLAAFVVPRAAIATPLSDEQRQGHETAWMAIGDALRQAAADLPPDAKIASLRAFQEETEQLVPALVMRNLAELGFPLEPGTSWTLKAQCERLGIAARHTRLLEAWLRMLEEAGWIESRTPDGWRVGEGGEPGGPDRHRSVAASIEAGRARVESLMGWVHDPQGLADWIFDSAARVPDVLREQGEAVELVFPEGDRRAAESLYQRNIVADYLGTLAARALTTAWRERAVAAPSDAVFRVLEVGAGVGGMTAHTLPALAALAPDAHYEYTDLSRFFLEIGEAKFGRYRGLHTGYCDINRLDAGQGREPASYDAILASNVLHNAHDVGLTLRQLRGLLRPGGVLIVHEATRDKRLQWVTAAAVLEAAAQAGEAGSAGHAGRGGESSLLSPAAWFAALRDAGFESVAAQPEADSPMGFVGQQVFVAQSRMPSASVDLAALAGRLAERLPHYMLPSSLASIERLPLSSNGKVDRQRLPVPSSDPAAARVDSAACLTAPETDLERQLALDWRAVLQAGEATPIGRESDFFGLGGDSLLATRLAARLNCEQGFEVPIRTLFQHTRLAGQAAALAQLRQASEGEIGLATVRTRPAAAFTPVFELNQEAAATLVCVHASDGHAAVYRPLAAALEGRVQCMALQSPGLEAGQQALSGVPEMAACYLQALHTDHRGGRPWHLMGWSMGAYVAAEMARQLSMGGQRVASLILLDPTPQQTMREAAGSQYGLWQSIATPELRRELNGCVVDQDAFERLPPTRRLSYWRVILGALPGIDDAALERMIAVLQANVAAMVDYRLPRLQVDQVVFCQASEHPDAWGDLIAPWRPALPATTRFTTVSGTHWDLPGDAQVARMVASLVVPSV
ncbi:non-ribosomal peptide synthetase [Burkholderia gladioli]|uniref:Putative siderophore synthetase protein n=1 Tax=Burkholderia gladioli (strain BSR3) TaxID=999541 RepID=F2LSV9_BURGS|nr:non-ribosomal peptide synthetase [Burkholderia gladioli]AEA65979.1 putative siderophore synthetase protein [Burkholderia gladioli BSR3]